MTLVDTNVLLDLLIDDPHWSEWSLRQLGLLEFTSQALINEIVYAELASQFSAWEALDSAVDSLELKFERTPRAALFMAGHAFKLYRRRGGARTSVLPDFFIGAHAAVIGAPILTRDPRHFRSYFPTVRLITP